MTFMHVSSIHTSDFRTHGRFTTTLQLSTRSQRSPPIFIIILTWHLSPAATESSTSRSQSYVAHIQKNGKRGVGAWVPWLMNCIVEEAKRHQCVGLCQCSLAAVVLVRVGMGMRLLTTARPSARDAIQAHPRPCSARIARTRAAQSEWTLTVDAEQGRGRGEDSNGGGE